jgi:L-arabinonolactonase
VSVATRLGSEIMELGEGPMWSPRQRALFWFDVAGRRLFRRGIGDGEATSWPLDRAPGSFGWRKEGVIFAFRNGLFLADRPEGPFRRIETPEIDFARERFNDGKVDRRGRFWVGSFNPGFAEGGGSLFRVDPDLTVRRMDSGVTMSNGIGWSPDDRTMYFADSRPGCIWSYEFDVGSGDIGERRCFLDYAGRSGRPDGLTVDAEGFLWVAEVTAGRIARYGPDATLDRTVTLPVSKPTSIVFGGPDYRTLFITSMRLGLSEQDLLAEPDAGGLFCIRCEVAGMPEPLFGG